MSNALLAASVGQLGRTSEGAEAIERIQANYSGVTLDRLSSVLPFTDQLHIDHLREGLIKAGWRDENK